MSDTPATISIDEGELKVYTDRRWLPVGHVVVYDYPNGTYLSVPDPPSAEGKEVTAVLESLPYVTKTAEATYFLAKPHTDQSDPSNDHASEAPEENKENN